MDIKIFTNKPWTSSRLGWAGYKRLGNLEVKGWGTSRLRMMGKE
jgi:hypothetical protein